MSKRLKITFSGISTLSPGRPFPGESKPERAFVLMAANGLTAKNQWNETIPQHEPFIYVPVASLREPAPLPAQTVNDETLGPCNIYFVRNARLRIDPSPPQPLEYFIDPRQRPLTKTNAEGRPLPVRPGSDDVAPPDDIRWLADMRELFPEHANLKATSKPSAQPIGREVAALVELPGGVLKANFPCKTVQPMAFEGFKAAPPAGLEPRVLATEFCLEMDYPDSARSVTLRLQPLRDGAISGVQGTALTLQWGDKAEINVRMGNDTKPEAGALRSFRRCDARTRDENGIPIPIPRDSDFDLHYELLDVPPALGRPVPHLGHRQTQFNGCDPAATGGG